MREDKKDGGVLIEDKGTGRKKSKEETALFLKSILIVSSLALCLVVTLFCPMFSKNQPDVGFSIGLSGLKLISLLGKGGEFAAEWVDSWGESVPITVAYPMIIPVVDLLFVLALAALIVGCVLRYTLGVDEKKKALLSGVVGYASIALSLGILVYYVYTLFAKIPTKNLYGEDCYMYNVFEMSALTLVIAIILLGAGLLELKLRSETIPVIKRFLPVYGFMVIPLCLILVFNFYPILLQTVLSFKDFNLADGIWGSEWVGLKQFSIIFKSKEIVEVIFRTMYISILRLIVGLIPPLILSVCLYDLKSQKLRSVFQSIVYIPHFFSWVVVYAITYALLSPEGLISSLFPSASGALVSEKWFMPIVIVTAVWKELGWGTILYLAALSGVDTSLFEAAKIDGAGPLQRVRNITLPSIKNTVIFLTIMNIGSILKGAGGEQLLLFYSATTKTQALVIDTWMLWKGMQELEYSLGAALSFFQSLIGMIMVLGCNRISKKTTDVGIW